MMSGDDVLTMPVAHRIEVFTGVGRRRRWPAETKAQIVAESYATSVGEVSDLYGVSRTQLFSWWRDARFAAGGGFAQVMVEDRPAEAPQGVIEVRIGDASLRLPARADPRMALMVIKALKAPR
jgi:transposase